MKLDTTSVVGLLVGWGSLLGAAIIAGTPLDVFLNIEAGLIIIGGTVGAALMATPGNEMRNVFRILKNWFFVREMNAADVIATMVAFSAKARREGLLGLEEDAETLNDQFMKKGIQLVIDGTDIELVRSIMETDLSFLEVRHKIGENIFFTMGGFAPTLGIIGTVMGLIHVLRSTNDPSSLGPAIAIAFIATFLGISFANLLFLPISFKLKARSAQEVLVREVMIEGILSISAGDNPRIVEEKLKAFMPPEVKDQLAKRQAAAAAAV